MKKTILFSLLMLTSTILLGQTAYIQVNGEPDLSVFLNNKFKAKTTAEYGGCIIENVTPGKNLIKIVKEGYIAFEETITLKKGEVFSYKVKPFVKNTVYITENGNSGETEKKAAVSTGKLIIQSVPINIKITMPSIEGVTNSPKTKDEWVVDNITAGNLDVTFIFNKKIIKKNIEIIGGETTNVFVNMMNGNFKTKNTIDEKIKVTHFIDSISTVYKFNPKMKKEDFKNYNPQASSLLKQQLAGNLILGMIAFNPKTAKADAPTQVSFDKNDELVNYGYSINITKKNKLEVTEHYNKIVAQLKNFPEKNRSFGNEGAMVTDDDVRVKFSMSNKKFFIFFETVD
ncbi:PEGA domain-containing protein [Flavobacterium sp. GT3P67]|uniref:PEGA domain-containing protein n=1 Tax=Flavobacterium sp. GT3P67 TaxID=2541722 RepID=UPI00104F687C|nr:PEGA domain-containing protein [Flavobacterium sp. GT3P67]TDE53069.1 hypothetical protein E0H99_10350 [Flavobacterium sp. GT3P67]